MNTVFCFFFISFFVFSAFCLDRSFVIELALGIMDTCIWLASAGKFESIDALARWHELSFGTHVPDPYTNTGECFRQLVEILKHWDELHRKGEI